MVSLAHADCEVWLHWIILCIVNEYDKPIMNTTIIEETEADGLFLILTSFKDNWMLDQNRDREREWEGIESSKNITQS